MYAKLALRNVVRSARDYTVYFFTLMLGVALFYAFNSVSDQQFMMGMLDTTSARIFDMTRIFLVMFSFVVAAVLAFLVLYANRFIIVRRKREFGMYLMLGMTPAKVARVVLYETVVIGVVALGVGLLVGIGVSQLLAFVTASLMSAAMEHYEFMISQHALILTLLCFAGIFALVGVFNVFTVTRRKLADLLSAHAKSQPMLVKHVVLRVVVFALSLVVLGLAYWQLKINALVMIDQHFAAATALMLVGTVMFYWSASGVVIQLIQRLKGVYFKKLGMFTTRQISSKVNTTFASMSVISVTLFFTITVLSCGMGLVKVFVNDLEESTQFDATVRADYFYDKDSSNPTVGYQERRAAFRKADPEAFKLWESVDGDMAAVLSQQERAWNQGVKAYAQVDRYMIEDVTYQDILPQDALTQSSQVDEAIRRSHVSVASASQVNQLRALTGQEPLSLADGECLVNNTMSASQKAAERLARSGEVIQLDGHMLKIQDQLLRQPVQTSAMADVGLDIVVPDAVIQGIKASGAVPYTSFLDVMYQEDRTQGDRQFTDLLIQAFPLKIGQKGAYSGPWKFSLWPASQVTFASDMVAQAQGFRMMITYLAMYIGLVMLISTAAVLAIQQLSETADSLSRYQKLSQIGANARMILGSLRTQTLAYFLAPLVLAVCHSACAISVMSETLFQALGVSIGPSIAMAALLVLLIYGCYLLVTYWGSRSMVKSVCKI